MTAQHQAVEAAIRSVGGIVHRDGNIFFTNKEMFLEAAALTRQLEVAAPVGNCGLSWSGFNVWGDEKSINEVKSGIHAKGVVPQLQQTIIDERAASRAPVALRVHMVSNTLGTSAGYAASFPGPSAGAGCRPGLALDSGEFIPATDLTASLSPAALADARKFGEDIPPLPPSLHAEAQAVGQGENA